MDYQAEQRNSRRCATYGAHEGGCLHCAHAYPHDPIRRNLDAVRTGAMVHDAGSDAELSRLGLIRVNSAGWYDLTPRGRATLEREVGEE